MATTSNQLKMDASSDDSEGGGRGSPFSLSLDVLAQVASDRLEKEPAKQGQPEKKKLTKRNVQTMEQLNLTQIKNLSEKLLVNMFSDTSADEMRRQYTYTCFLLPDACCEAITVYGNELKARLRMRDHLHSHIQALQDKEDKDDSFEFKAEPIHARKKRLAAEKALEKKLKKIVVAGGPRARGKPSKTSPNKYTSLLPKAGVSMIADASNPALFPPARPPKVRKNIVRHFANKQIGIRLPTTEDETSGVSASQTVPAATVTAATTTIPQQQIPIVEATPAAASVVTQGVTQGVALYTSTANALVENSNTITLSTPTVIETTSEAAVKEMTLNFEQNQAFVMELLTRSQPYQDHNYTTVFGKKLGWENQDADSDKEDEEEEQDPNETESSANVYTPMEPASFDPNRSVMIKVADGRASANHIHIPVIRLQRIGQEEPATTQHDIIQAAAQASNINTTPFTNVVANFHPQATQSTQHQQQQQQQQLQVSQSGELIPQPMMTYQQQQQQGQQVYETMNSAVDAAGQLKMHCQRPYPPMPKSDMALQGRVFIKEELVSDPDHADEKPSFLGRKAKKKAAQWEAERKLALKCIRELRMRKGYKEDGNLVCRICKNKAFTATATLMYHYRSHAGIKPFVCLICNTTFTRQHSLNYHMLIHNNQSRFTCKDCGRKFRHPSHFKEHLRRHTGETPFHCTDCPLRFKTRNTYKRHLMTRHGKLLTANGIKVMPPGDFIRCNYKVRGGATSGTTGEDNDADPDDRDSDTDPTNEARMEEDDDDDVEEDEEEIMDSNSMPTTSSSVSGAGATTPSPDTPAANKLLQFCAQVANQMGQVMPPSQ